MMSKRVIFGYPQGIILQNYTYSNNARFLNSTINVWKVYQISGNLIGKAILNGKKAKLIRDVVTGLILSLC